MKTALLQSWFKPPRWRTIPILLVTIVIWLPAILLATALVVSAAAGCRLDEGSVHPCPIAGIDLGDLLYSFAVSGWLILVTGPFMGLTVLVWAGRLVFLGIRRLRRRRSA